MTSTMAIYVFGAFIHMRVLYRFINLCRKKNENRLQLQLMSDTFDNQLS